MLSDDLLTNFALGRVFRDNSQRINSIDFDKNGDYLVTASNDEKIQLYNVDKGIKEKCINVKKYGVNLVRFTHASPNCILTASNNNNNDNAIRYHSFYDNRYLRYFSGHNKKVISMEICPQDDTFLSASLDKTIRLWDIRTNISSGIINTMLPGCIAYDPQGMIFATAIGDNKINLYDTRNYQNGPFAAFNLNGIIVNMEFSHDGKDILCSTQTDRISLIDSFDGKIKHEYVTRSNKSKYNIEATFSPDDKYILTGSEDGDIYIYDRKNGKSVTIWNGHKNACTMYKI